ncbi:hypothetical protein QVD17_27777 [Tagetes erecta]|uniref:Uncharacterized protein n=1 Tax=Tagetes erecta TaxID=13708 RepID=A0AAD8KDU9_TARER|nr:hypothetical protein QVD17_27777 [Tagetes erecta]
MLCLLESHDMLGFITHGENTVLGKEKNKVGDYMLWRRSDALVKSWILALLSQQTLKYVVNSISDKDLTAQNMCGMNSKLPMVLFFNINMKEVERFVCTLNIIQKNSFGETPQIVFTKEHKELVIEGEKWMKETAQSYTITATLITTIVFAAACRTCRVFYPSRY